MIKIDQYTALSWEERDGVYSLIEGWEGKNGDFKITWITEKWGKEKLDKTMPKRVKLGDKETAVRVLQTLLAELGVNFTTNDVKKTIDDDSIPF